MGVSDMPSKALMTLTADLHNLTVLLRDGEITNEQFTRVAANLVEEWAGIEIETRGAHNVTRPKYKN